MPTFTKKAIDTALLTNFLQIEDNKLGQPDPNRSFARRT